MWSGQPTMNSFLLVILFWVLLIVSCGYALWRGRKYERLAALVFIGASLFSFFGESPVDHRYAGIEITDLMVDNGVLVALVVIALVSDRFWPLWAAGLQTVDSMSHLMKVIDAGMVPKVYGAAERFWSYPILVVLLVGAWRSHRRSQCEPQQQVAV
jgi:preprotein translocase subunit Sec61beta